MSDPEIVITFDGPADVWRVRRGDQAVAITLVEMTDEYYRWVHAGSPGEWRDHAQAFCRKRLGTATESTNR